MRNEIDRRPAPARGGALPPMSHMPPAHTYHATHMDMHRQQSDPYIHRAYAHTDIRYIQRRWRDIYVPAPAPETLPHLGRRLDVGPAAHQLLRHLQMALRASDEERRVSGLPPARGHVSAPAQRIYMGEQRHMPGRMQSDAMKPPMRRAARGGRRAATVYICIYG